MLVTINQKYIKESNFCENKRIDTYIYICIYIYIYIYIYYAFSNIHC